MQCKYPLCSIWNFSTAPKGHTHEAFGYIGLSAGNRVLGLYDQLQMHTDLSFGLVEAFHRVGLDVRSCLLDSFVGPRIVWLDHRRPEILLVAGAIEHTPALLSYGSRADTLKYRIMEEVGR